MLDRNIAFLYGTETKEINKAVRNNPDKFPEKYCFTLQVSEKQYVMENLHQMQSLKKSTVEPRAFTEGGLYMLSTILKSPEIQQQRKNLILKWKLCRYDERILCILAGGRGAYAHYQEVNQQKSGDYDSPLFINYNLLFNNLFSFGMYDASNVPI